MISSFGYYSLLTATLLSLFEIITYIKNYNQKNHVAHQFIFYKFSFYLIIISFVLLIISFANSDFSIISVYENSHTAKTLFYKIAATWGNHEGSILLFILVISAYGYCFIISKRKIDNHLKATVVFIQNILLIIFLFFLLFTSNPFEKILPIPNEGLGLNPILQDPLLVIHPPFLYLGYVGFSLIFSLTLAALINDQFNIDWSKLAKNWIFLPWTFLTVGIGLGSFWAYYELGWGGYWFWDPVENASLMPWIAATALIHSVLVMEKTGKLFSWTAILALLTFILSLFGTF
jgi:cytochrome c-type biogenesis protein CcmF